MKLKDIDINDPQHLITYGDEFCERSAKARRRQERKWLLNILFIIGDQLCSINEHTGGINRTKISDDPEYVVRVVNNRIMPIYRTMVAKLTKSKPIPLVTPNTRNEDDIQAARACTKLMINHWLSLDLDDGHQEIAGWLVSCGNVFVKQFYNPNKGDTIALDDEIATNVKDTIGGEVENGIIPEGKAQKVMEILNSQITTIGDTDLEIRNPFCCYPEPGKNKMKKLRIFADSEFLTPDEIFDKHGVEIEPSTRASNKHIYSVGIGDIINTGELDFEATTDSLVEVREIYILPNKKFPKGAKYKWAGDQLLGEVEECHEIPFTQFGLIRVPGKFWYESLITDLIPMQRRWNELLSKIEMHNDLYNDPPIILDPNTVDIDEWVAKPGLLLEKQMQGGEPPWVMPVPALDQAIFQELNILDKQFEIVPVLNKVSFGKDTPNARSGLAINYLQEKDDDVIRPLIAEMETSYTLVFKRDFKLCQDNYEEDRGIATVGEDDKVEWIEFMKTNLQANVDVRVEPQSAMPRSIAAQQAMVLELMDRGFFIDPRTGMNDNAKVSRYLEFGDVEELYEDITMDIDHARRTIDKLKKGEFVEIQEWFDINTHLYEVNRFRKTTAYDELTPDIRALVDTYGAQCLALARPTTMALPNGAEVPMLSMDQGQGDITQSSAPMVPPSMGASSPPASEVAPPGAGGPLISEEELQAMMDRLRTLKPDLWREIKTMKPDIALDVLSAMIMIGQGMSDGSTQGQ